MKISDEKKERISEQILAFLYSISPKPIFTVEVARELARDEEFTKKLLLKLKSQGLATEIKKNPAGKQYIRRSRWVLSDAAYQAYRNKQDLE